MVLRESEQRPGSLSERQLWLAVAVVPRSERIRLRMSAWACACSVLLGQQFHMQFQSASFLYLPGAWHAFRPVWHGRGELPGRTHQTCEMTTYLHLSMQAHLIRHDRRSTCHGSWQLVRCTAISIQLAFGGFNGNACEACPTICRITPLRQDRCRVLSPIPRMQSV